MEIANAFGPLKAYHFEIDDDLSEQYAILEVTLNVFTSVLCLFFCK